MKGNRSSHLPHFSIRTGTSHLVVATHILRALVYASLTGIAAKEHSCLILQNFAIEIKKMHRLCLIRKVPDHWSHGNWDQSGVGFVVHWV